MEKRLQDISAIDDDQVGLFQKMTIKYHQLEEVEALVKDLVAASQKTKEALELVTTFHFLHLESNLTKVPEWWHPICNVFQNVKHFCVKDKLRLIRIWEVFQNVKYFCNQDYLSCDEFKNANFFFASKINRGWSCNMFQVSMTTSTEDKNLVENTSESPV